MVKIPPKFWNVIIPVVTLLAGYLGYEPVQEARQSFSSVEVNVDSTPVEVTVEQNEHSHPTHSHKHTHPELEELKELILYWH